MKDDFCFSDGGTFNKGNQWWKYEEKKIANFILHSEFFMNFVNVNTILAADTNVFFVSLFDDWYEDVNGDYFWGGGISLKADVRPGERIKWCGIGWNMCVF